MCVCVCVCVCVVCVGGSVRAIQVSDLSESQVGLSNKGRARSRACCLASGRRGSVCRVESGGCTRGGLVAATTIVIWCVCVCVCVFL